MQNAEIIARKIAEIRPRFLLELSQRLDRLEEIRDVLETAPDIVPLLGEIELGAHKTVGLATTLGFPDLGNLAHDAEMVVRRIAKAGNGTRPNAQDLERIDLMLGEMASSCIANAQFSPDHPLPLTTMPKQAIPSQAESGPCRHQIRYDSHRPLPPLSMSPNHRLAGRCGPRPCRASADLARPMTAQEDCHGSPSLRPKSFPIRANRQPASDSRRWCDGTAAGRRSNTSLRNSCARLWSLACPRAQGRPLNRYRITSGKPRADRAEARDYVGASMSETAPARRGSRSMH